MSLHTTGSQTVGPFYRIGMEAGYLTTIAGPEVPGERVAIRGRVLDGDGNSVPDAVIETWQADAAGRYAHPEDGQPPVLAGGFVGWGRAPTDDAGWFALETIKPGQVAGPGDSLQAPHLVVLVFMRGLLRHLVTRMYFPGEASNAGDPILALVPAERRATLVARPARAEENFAPHTLVWDIHLQGPDETVFFDA